eukprot:COSAG02_NODE_71409_length_191_cov_27.652174_1_plen_25_part_10
MLLLWMALKKWLLWKIYKPRWLART